MKPIIQILFLIFLFSACNKSAFESNFSESGTFIPNIEQRSLIIGQLTNIKDFRTAPKRIFLYVDDITIDGQHTFETSIDKEGRFLFDIPLYHSINTWLKYADYRITPYLFPNDTLYLTCNIDKINGRLSIVSGEFDDKHDEFQTTFMSLNSWMNNQLGSFRDNKPTDLSPQDLKALYLEFEKELLDRVENKVITDSLPDLLADCLKYSASYSIYNDLIKLGRTLETPMERQAFYSFITDSIAFNEKALICSDYNSFHNAYRFNVESSPGVYLEPKERTREQFRLEITTKELEQNLKTRNGIWAEFLAASTMYTTGFLEEEIDQHVITTYSTLIEENFKEPYIRQLLLTKCDETSEKVAGIRNLKIPKKAKLNQYDSLSGSDLLEKIMKDNQGKFVYIDIWATWCSPCKRQIPHSIQMQERYPEVEFIYLCCRSAKDTWHNVIKQYQLNGTHILLTDEQYEFLYEHFSLSGVPHYILINKEGKVVFNDNPGCKTEQVLEIKLEQLTNN